MLHILPAVQDFLYMEGQDVQWVGGYYMPPAPSPMPSPDLSPGLSPGPPPECPEQEAPTGWRLPGECLPCTALHCTALHCAVLCGVVLCATHAPAPAPLQKSRGRSLSFP